MNGLNKKIRTLCGALCVIFAASVAAPRPANAWLVTVGSVNILGNGSNASIFGSALICVILFPFCILDQKDAGAGATTSADLVANGYSSAQIKTILADQNTLAGLLTAKGLALRVGSTDTRETLSSQIRSVYPKVSETYLDYAADASGLK